MPYPRDWRRYMYATPSDGGPTPEFARFAARHKLASSFEDVIGSKKVLRPDINRVIADLTWDPATEQFT